MPRFRKISLYVLGFGAVAYVLPFFGLVLKPRGARQGMNPEDQQMIGLTVVVIGAIMLALSFAGTGLGMALGKSRAAAVGRWARRIVLGGVGLFALWIVYLIVLNVVVRPFRKDNTLEQLRAANPPVAAAPGPGMRPPDAGPHAMPVAQGGAPDNVAAGPVGPDGRPAGFPGAPGPGHVPPGGFRAGPPPGFGQPGPPAAPVVPVRFELSNGQAMPAEGDPPRVTFRFDFQADGEMRPGPVRYFWVIATANGSEKKMMIPPRLRGQSTFEFRIRDLSHADAPFQVHAIADSFGPQGMSTEVISNTIPLVWSDGVQDDG